MYYELYIDVFFLVNFMMDFILLQITRRILRCSATHGRVCLGAAAGALLTCAVVMIPIPYAFIKFILFHGLVNIVMLKAGLKISWDRTFVKAYVVLYISGILVGGVFEYLRQYIKVGSLFFALAVVSYFAVLGIWNFLSYLSRLREYRCEAVLYKDEKVLRVEAVIDTGNSLKDAVTGKPVSIVDESVVKTLIDAGLPEGIRYIPYHSVGKEAGVMPVITLDKMCVCQKSEKWIDRPLIGICEGQVASDGAYRMILNPDIL